MTSVTNNYNFNLNELKYKNSANKIYNHKYNSINNNKINNNKINKKINIKINKDFEYGKGILYNENYNVNNFCIIKYNDSQKIVEIDDIKTDNFNYITNISVSDLDYNKYSFKPLLGTIYPLYSSPFIAFYTSKLGKITLDYINEYPPCGYYMGYGYMKDDIPYQNGFIYETNKWNKTYIKNKLLRYSIGLKNLNEPLNHSYISIKIYKHENNESNKEFNRKKKYWLNRCYKWLLKKEKNGNFAYYNYKRNQFLRNVIKYYRKNKENIKELKNKELNNINKYTMNNNSINYNNENIVEEYIKYDEYGNEIKETDEERETRLYREDFEYRMHNDPATMHLLYFHSRRYPNGQLAGWSKMDDEFLESIGMKETEQERLEKIKSKNNEMKKLQIKREDEKKLKNKHNNKKKNYNEKDYNEENYNEENYNEEDYNEEDYNEEDYDAYK